MGDGTAGDTEAVGQFALREIEALAPDEELGWGHSELRDTGAGCDVKNDDG